uniref:Ubiquitin carboxyl-terminal hydrolase n=1 Tax=Parastrongyloides trichosuri TaxID=131310 RepID=A0A0N4Z4H2_PARTI
MEESCNGEWNVIELDGSIYTEMLKHLGVFGVKVEEIYSLDESTFTNLHPIYGLVFFYKWRPGQFVDGSIGKPIEGMFFAQQVIANTCGTQAIINLVLNITDENVDIGKILEDLKTTTSFFDPASCGLSLGNNDTIREIHNSFGKQQFFDNEYIPQNEKEEVLQYVTFVPFKGRIYELDGLREAPIDHGDYDIVNGWLPVVVECLKKRIKAYSEGEINFYIMAVCGDRLQKLEKDLDILKSTIGEDNGRQIMELEREAQGEFEKREILRKENVRRSFNYVPFLTEFLKVLGRDRKLLPLIEQEIRKQST